MTALSAQTLCDALVASIPPGGWEPLIVTLTRAYYGTIFIPDWPADIELDIEEIETSPDKPLIDAALCLVQAAPSITIEGDPRNWLTARVRKSGMAPPPEPPERSLSPAEQDQARGLLGTLDKAFAAVQKPDPLTELASSHMPLESRAFERVDWERADYTHFTLTHEGWICAPLPAKAWLTPRLLRILLLRRTHPGVDNISIDIKGLLDERDALAALLTPAQDHALRAAVAFYDSLFQTEAPNTRP